MIILSKGKIIINGKECNNPELLFFTLKDYAENNYLEINNEIKKAV